MILDLRYAIRDGIKVLQQKKKRIIERHTFYNKIEIWWEDVEVIKDEDEEDEEDEEDIKLKIVENDQKTERR